MEVLSAAVALLLAAQPGAAQRRVAPDSLRRIQSVAPRSGPPGTPVSIYTENLPIQAKVHVGVGAVGSGFEAIAEGVQGQWGEITASVRVPASASWDHPIAFIIFNGNFSPTAISDPFHVTNADGVLRRKGRITDEGQACISMRDEDGYLYSLTGAPTALEPGDEVVVEGTFEGSSTCLEGDTIAVLRLVSGS